METWNSIKQVIQAVSQEEDPLGALRTLLLGLVNLTNASVGRAYVLNLQGAAFIQQVEVGDPLSFLGASAPPIPISVLDSQTPTSCLEKAIRHKTLINVTTTNKQCANTSGISSHSTSVLVAPILRGRSALGIIVLESLSEIAFSEKDVQTAETAAAIVLSLLDKRFALDLLRAVQRPVDFFQPLTSFLDDTLLLIAEASKMPYIVLRESESSGQALRCIAQFGFDVEKSVLDLEPLSEYPTFHKAFHDQVAVVESDTAVPHLTNLRERPALAPVRSFVAVPVKVGTVVFGTLSFATPCLYDFSPLELAGFETISNAIGTSITNFRNAERVHDIFVKNARLAISITGLEVAQSARHEARTIVNTCVTHIATLQALLQKPKENIDRIRLKLGDLDKDIGGIQAAMDKIRDASKWPTEDLTAFSLKALWREAIALVAGRITDVQVKVDILGKDMDIEMYHERLRHAFLNLLLNSLDAFNDRRLKSGRTIAITIDPKSVETADLKVRYVDNATGVVDPTKLKVPGDIDSTKPVKDLIFEAGVTSKPTGSGYGLYLVRRIITEHYGSIDLIDSRNGMVFDIHLPKRQTIAAVERRERETNRKEADL